MTAESPSFLRSVQECTGSADLPPRGSALVALAEGYAAVLDAERDGDRYVEVLDKLGPKLQSTLTALGLAVALPAAGKPDAGKPAVTVSVDTAGVNPVDVLASLRAARERRTG